MKVDAQTARRFLVTRHFLAPARAVGGGRDGVLEVLNLWWEDGFAPRRADGFGDAMRDALAAYLGCAGADRIEWAPHLAEAQRRSSSRLSPL